MGHYLLSSSTISGDSVVNAQGEDLGHVKDLMINPDSGEIEYAVLDFGGFLGMGDKFFAVPFRSFTVDRAKHRMVLNVDKERLKEAPGFDKNDWPDFADDSFTGGVNSFYQ